MPKGEFSCENSPLAVRISKIWFRNPDHNLALPEYFSTCEQSPHIPCSSVPACRTSFLSANCLQLPEVSLVADPLASVDSALFSERFLFR